MVDEENFEKQLEIAGQQAEESPAAAVFNRTSSQIFATEEQLNAENEEFSNAAAPSKAEMKKDKKSSNKKQKL